jgi:ATP-dependent RNA helicase RhlE
MPKTIVELSQKILGDFEQVTIKPQQATAEKVEQGVYFVAKGDKGKLLIHLIETRKTKAVLVFSRTKHGANKIVKILDKAEINSAAIHGNKSQTARQNALNDFKDGKLTVLVATDIAARGIDIDALSLVVNYDLPNVPETYVHRIGRTGRAEASGVALSFCDGEERSYLRDIQKLIKQNIPVISEHPFMDDGTTNQESEDVQRPPRQKQNNPSKSQNQRNRNKNRNPRN